MRPAGARTTWAALTRDPRKVELYERETYFREGLDDVERVWPAGPPTEALLASTALLVLKPDGLRHGVAPVVVRTLASWGYRVSWVHEVAFARHVWRELWRHQLTVASLRRLEFNDRLFVEPGLLLLLHRSAPGGLPASVELSVRKGSASLAQQRPDSLRARLGQPDRVLSLLHAADEPVDVVRELGLFYDRELRTSALAAVAAGREVAPATVLRAASALAGGSPEPGLPSVPDAVRRIRRSLEAATDPASRQLLDLVDAAPAGHGLDWGRAAGLVERTEAHLDRWDLLVASAGWLRADDPGFAKAVEGVDAARWAS